jgi:hypothetical protein
MSANSLLAVTLLLGCAGRVDVESRDANADTDTIDSVLDHAPCCLAGSNGPNACIPGHSWSCGPTLEQSCLYGCANDSGARIGEPCSLGGKLGVIVRCN